MTHAAREIATAITDGHTVAGIEYLPGHWECTCGERGTDGSAGVESHRRHLLTGLDDDEIEVLRMLMRSTSAVEAASLDSYTGVKCASIIAYVMAETGLLQIFKVMDCCEWCGSMIDTFEITDSGQELLNRIDAA